MPNRVVDEGATTILSTSNDIAQLLEANEQLVIATLRAQADTEIANIALINLKKSVELDATTQANQNKNEFLSRVSHELRTPLNAILGFSHIMLMDDDECDYLEEVQRERLEAIRLAGQHMLSLTNDLLDLARIDHDNICIDMQEVDVHALIRSSEIFLRQSALERKIEIRNLANKNECRIMANERALGQVLLNLVSNAIKYNRPGGWVSVTTKVELGDTVIVVEDNGLGMSSTQLANLFQPFNRLGAEYGSVPGYGLGLVISKRLVESMQGQVFVQSIENIGTTIEVHLCNSVIPASLSLDTQETALRLPPAAPMTTTREVLYVEDNPVNAMIMKQLFGGEPAWSLLIATTGQMGIELATSQRPSLLLLDMQLPDMTGLQVFLALKQHNLLPPKGCIALSADAMPEHVAIALNAGFSQYWTKPINMKQTMISLREILQADV